MNGLQSASARSSGFQYPLSAVTTSPGGYLGSLMSSIGEIPKPPSMSDYYPKTYQVDQSGRVVLAPDYSDTSLSNYRRNQMEQSRAAYEEQLRNRARAIEEARRAEAEYYARRSQPFEFPEYTPIARTDVARSAVLRGFTPSRGGAPRIASRISGEEARRRLASSYEDYRRFLRQRAADTAFYRGQQAASEEYAQIEPTLRNIYGIEVQPVSYV